MFALSAILLIDLIPCSRLAGRSRTVSWYGAHQNRANTNFSILLDRRKDSVYQFGGHISRNNLVTVELECQVLPEEVFDSGIDALFAGNSDKLIPLIGDTGLHIERKHVEDGCAVCA